MHSHSHDHHHDQSTKRIALAFFLNLAFTIIEFVGGWLTNSTAIMADAVHDLGDCISIGLGWFLSKISSKGTTTDFSYGYRRFSLLGALINGLVLMIGSVWVLSQAIPKLFEPQMPVVEGMFGLAVLGVVVNGYAAFKLSKGKTLNEKVLNWHLLEDVLGWIAVLIVSVTLMFFEWPILDPALSIVFTLFILFNVGRNLWTTTKLFLQAVPDKGLSEKLFKLLESNNEVSNVHHLHLWSLDGEHHVLTAHLVVDTPLEPNQQLHLKEKIAKQLSGFDLVHTTIELEFGDEQCRDS